MSSKNINIEEGIPENEEYLNEDTNVRQRNGSTAATTNGSNGINKQSHRLSLISQKYDVDGDGVLDSAEQAMRDLDKSNKGFLSNDQVYKVVQEQMKVQKQFLGMKRILIVLGCFTVILALSNLATAWVAAVLVKDTQAKDDTLYNKAGDKIMGTRAISDTYEIETDENSQSRLLANYQISTGMTIKKNKVVSINGDTSTSNIKRIISSNPTIEHTFSVGSNGKSRNGDVYTFTTTESSSIIVDCTGAGNGDNCPVELTCPTTEPTVGSDCTGYAGLSCNQYSTSTSATQPPNCIDKETGLCHTPDPISPVYECDSNSGYLWQSIEVLPVACTNDEGCQLATEEALTCPTDQPNTGDDCTGYANMACDEYNWSNAKTCEDSDGVCFERPGHYTAQCTCDDFGSGYSWECVSYGALPCQNEGCELPSLEIASMTEPGGGGAATLNCAVDASAYEADSTNGCGPGKAILSSNTCYPGCNATIGEECYECEPPTTTDYCVYFDSSVFNGQTFCSYDSVGCNTMGDCANVSVPSDSNPSDIIEVQSVGCGSGYGAYCKRVE